MLPVPFGVISMSPLAFVLEIVLPEKARLPKASLSVIEITSSLPSQ